MAEYRQWLGSREEPGKVLGLTDLLEELNCAIHGGAPEHRRLPESRAAVAQYLLLYESAADETPPRAITPSATSPASSSILGPVADT